MSENAPADPLLKVCALLNKHQAKYLVVGGHACILHGLVRTTEDVDLLIQEDKENYRRVIAALSELEDHAASELTANDFDDNVVIKVADEVEVDVSRRAWTVSYDEAASNALEVLVDDVAIPYMNLRDLIKSKATYREKDKWDVQGLQRLNDRKIDMSDRSIFVRFLRAISHMLGRNKE